MRCVLWQEKNLINQRNEFYIITNGKETEKNYFEALKSKKSPYDVKVKFENADPLGLVEYAKGFLNDSNQVWIVFDVDYTHKDGRLIPAINKAEKEGIKYAFSNLAFEVWLISHFEKCERELNADGHKQILDRYLSIGGVNVAEAVTAWVNGIAKEFYKKHQSVELQFGLHATSVKKHLQYIKNVDKRIKIIWEDCGAFPYNYSPAAVADFAETEEFTETITTLRGENERFGAVLKGMTTLYWDVFTHVDESFVLGRSSEESINALYEDRRPAWKYIQAEWIKNAEYMRKTVTSIRKTTNGAADMQLLLEYGAFEKEIFFSGRSLREYVMEPR